MNTTTRKMIAVDPDNWKVYNKIAKHLSKQVGFRVPLDGALNTIAQEYLKLHPEV